MDGVDVSPDRSTWQHLALAIRDFARSGVRGRAAGFAGSLFVLLLGVNGLNVVNSYVGRDFMTAIEQRSFPEFVSEALLYAGVFALSTVVAVLVRFCEERLALLWREWLTGSLIDAYFAGRLYQRLTEVAGIENPDQRIVEDAHSLATTTISFLLMLLNGTFTILAFSGVLWSISSALFGVAIAYALVGSVLTLSFGRPLVGLNYAQSDRDAELRADLVRVHEHAESIALGGHEGMLRTRARRRLVGLVANMKRIIAVNRNVSFFTTGYSYGIQLIPALIVGPLFIRGKVEFGVIPQSAMAFSHLLGAFSLVVTQFGSISSYGAVLARLRALVEAVEGKGAAPGVSRLEIVESCPQLAWEGLTLRRPESSQVLIAGLSAAVEPGSRWLVTGPNAAAQAALLRATAGLWQSGEGRILRPEKNAFLPESPYLPPSTLAELLIPGAEAGDSQARVTRLLEPLGLAELVKRAGGIDRDVEWARVLSLREQQLLSTARILASAPRVALLHELGTTLDPEHVAQVLSLLAKAEVAVVLVGQKVATGGFDAVLELELDGTGRLSLNDPTAEQGISKPPG